MADGEFGVGLEAVSEKRASVYVEMGCRNTCFARLAYFISKELE